MIYLELDDKAVEALERYTRVINARLTRKKLPRVTRKHLAEVIIKFFLKENHQRIISEHRTFVREATRSIVGKNLSREDVEAIGISDLPDPTGDERKGYRAILKHATRKKSVRSTPRKQRSTPAGPPPKP